MTQSSAPWTGPADTAQLLQSRRVLHRAACDTPRAKRTVQKQNACISEN
jgi:hypothetical protein